MGDGLLEWVAQAMSILTERLEHAKALWQKRAFYAPEEARVIKKCGDRRRGGEVRDGEAKGPEVQKGRALALSVSSISVLFKAWGIR